MPLTTGLCADYSVFTSIRIMRQIRLLEFGALIYHINVVCAVLQTAHCTYRYNGGGYAAPAPLRYITASIIPLRDNACRYV